MSGKTELLPCPFCGGEAETWDGAGLWHVVCAKCGTVGSPCLTEAEAIAAWNARAERGTLTAEQVFEVIERCVKFYEGGDYDAQEIADELNARAERTCKFVSSKGSDYPPVCSACGYELGIYDCEWFDDGAYGYDGNYCPNCGRKVVEE